MTTWDDLTRTVPELAACVQQRFAATGLGYLATVRRDGSPRICGVEPLFADGELWLGMMPGSRKAADLRRDPRGTLHAANIDKQVTDGDARVGGRAVEIVAADAVERARERFAEVNGQAPPPGPFDLFRLDVTELVFLRPAVDHLVLESWTPARGYRRIERR